MRRTPAQGVRAGARVWRSPARPQGCGSVSGSFVLGFLIASAQFQPWAVRRERLSPVPMNLCRLRFQDEAASTGRIHHPNAVTVYESCQEDDGTPYIADDWQESRIQWLAQE